MLALRPLVSLTPPSLPAVCTPRPSQRLEEAAPVIRPGYCGSSLPQEGGEGVDDYSKGVVFYLSRGERKVVGVLTWNLFGKMDIARKVELLAS